MFKIPQDLCAVKLHPAKFFLEGQGFKILPKRLAVQIECTSNKYKRISPLTQTPAKKGVSDLILPDNCVYVALWSSPTLFLFFHVSYSSSASFSVIQQSQQQLRVPASGCSLCDLVWTPVLPPPELPGALSTQDHLSADTLGSACLLFVL